VGLWPSAMCLVCVSAARRLCRALVKVDRFFNPRATPFQTCNRIEKENQNDDVQLCES